MKPKAAVAAALFTAVLATAGFCPPDAAARDPLRVGVSPISPFVIFDAEEPSGFSIDLWQALAARLGIPYEYVRCDGVADKLSRLERGEVDIAIGGITITQAREKRFDFSHPTFHTGLDILVPTAARPDLWAMGASLFRGNKPALLGAMLLLVVVAGHLIWLAERRASDRPGGFSERYVPGVLEGIYWALVTASTVGYGDKVPHRWVGRTLTCVLILVFLPLFGFLVAELSSDITVVALKTSIDGPEDLAGARVGVVTGTTGEEEADRIRARVRPFAGIGEACDALVAGEVDAVVYDAPSLLHFANTAGRGRVQVLGRPFVPQDYGLAMPPGAPYREAVNRGLLGLLESGETASIRAAWFGEGN